MPHRTSSRERISGRRWVTPGMARLPLRAWRRRAARRSSSFQPPAVDEEEVAAVADTLRSGWLTTGPRTAELEQRMREYLEASTCSPSRRAPPRSTLARRARRRARRRGDHELAHVARDGERDRPLRRDARLRRHPRRHALHRPGAGRASSSATRTKAILPVDLYGQPADLDPLAALGLPVVEDAAHAAESRYRGRKVGSIADVTCFSLYATKNIAAGEGGLIATSRDDLAAALDDLRVMRRGHGSLYDIAVPGYKANLSDVLAAIALVQLDKVERHAEIRGAPPCAVRRGIAGLDGITAVARDPRDLHANHCSWCASTRSAPARAATSTSARSPTRTSARRSTSCRCIAQRLPRSARAAPAAAARHRACRSRGSLAAVLTGALGRRRRATRSPPCTGFTRGSRDEPAHPPDRDARRLGARGRLHPR